VEHHGAGAERGARVQGGDQRDEGLLEDVAVLAGAVEQVDGVDQQRVELGRVERRVIARDLIGRVLARLPRARVLVEELDRAAVALGAALNRPGRTAGR